MKKRISAIVPCYNEEESLPLFYKRICEVADKLPEADFEFLFINDGSRDGTLRILRGLAGRDERVRYISFSRNFGKEAGMLAGLEHATGDYVAILDADLQDDVDAIDRFVAEYQAGSDIVYGVRSSRKTDTVFKRSTAVGYYRFLRWMGVEIVENHADYRLMSRRALDALAQYDEVNLFLRGIVPLIGFRTSVVAYERHERFAGESKYPLKKMLAFAIDGITSFSVKPIRLITALGVIIFVASGLCLLWLLITKLFGYTVTGWTTLMGSIWALGGIQLLCLGILGEYIGKIYKEVKHRPKYIVDVFLNDQ